MDTSSKFIYLKSHEAFFLKHGRRLEYSKNQHVMRGDDPSAYVFFLLEGLVKLSFIGSHNDERIVGFFLPGMNFAQTRSFFEADGGGLEVVTVKPSILYRVPREEFLKELNTNAEFKDEYMQQLMRNQIYLLDRTIYMGEGDIYHRMVRWLLLMAKYYGEPTNGGTLITPELTQAMICNFLHASRESVSSNLKKLTNEGVISITKKHITLDVSLCKSKLE